MKRLHALSAAGAVLPVPPDGPLMSLDFRKLFDMREEGGKHSTQDSKLIRQCKNQFLNLTNPLDFIAKIDDMLLPAVEVHLAKVPAARTNPGKV